MSSVLLIGLVFLAYLVWTGVGVAWLVLPERFRAHIPVFAPVLGACIIVAVAHGFAHAGVSSRAAVTFTVVGAGVANVVALIRVKRRGLAATVGELGWDREAFARGAATGAAACMVFFLAVSPLVLGPTTGRASTIGYNGDAITHLLLAESYGEHGFAADIFDRYPHWREYSDYPFRPMHGYLVGTLVLVDHARLLAGVPHFRAYSVVGAVLLALTVMAASVFVFRLRRWWLAAPVLLVANPFLYVPLVEDYLPQMGATMILPVACLLCMEAVREGGARAVVSAALAAHALFLTNPFGIALLGAIAAAYLALAAARFGGRRTLHGLAALAAVLALAFALNPVASASAAGGVGRRASIALKHEEGGIGEKFSLTRDAAFGFFGFDRCPPSPFMEVRTEMLGRTCGHDAPQWAAYRAFAWAGLALVLSLLISGAAGAVRAGNLEVLAFAGTTGAAMVVATAVDAYTFFKAYSYALVPAAVLVAHGLEQLGGLASRLPRRTAGFCFAAILVLQLVPAGNFMFRYRTGGVLVDRGFEERVEHLRRETGPGATVVFRAPLINKWWYQYFLRDIKAAWWRIDERCRHIRFQSLHRKECDDTAFAKAMENSDSVVTDFEGEPWSLRKVVKAGRRAAPPDR